MKIDKDIVKMTQSHFLAVKNMSKIVIKILQGSTVTHSTLMVNYTPPFTANFLYGSDVCQKL